MVGWAGGCCVPEEGAVAFLNWLVVYAGFAALHEAVFVKLPQFVAVCTVPLAGLVAPFILEAYGDAVVCEGP